MGNRINTTTDPKAERSLRDAQLRAAMKGASGSAQKFGGGSSRKALQKQKQRCR